MAGRAEKLPTACAPCDNLARGSVGVGQNEDMAVFSWVTHGVWGWHYHGGLPPFGGRAPKERALFILV